MKKEDVYIIMIDLFCGGGGTSEAAKMSGSVKVIAAVNHDPLAIKSHRANHKNVVHFDEDILFLDMKKLQKVVEKARAKYPGAKLAVWASLECTNYSDAKGGLPRDEDSRTLANGMFRYLEALKPDYFMVENVEEFMSWGPLIPKVVKAKTGDFCPWVKNKKTKRWGAHLIPESRTQGKDYVRWVKAVQGMGYEHDWRLLLAADYGAVTIRERYFGVFYKPGLPFAWPRRTHAKKPQRGDLFQDEMKPWRAVKEVLDFSDLGKSIFGRKEDLVDKTLIRILKGLKKFHGKQLIATHNSPGYCLPVERPIGALTTVPGKSLVTPFIYQYNGKSKGRSIEEPAATVTTGDKIGLCTPFLQTYYGNSTAGRSTEEAAATVTTNDRIAMITPFIYRQFGQGRYSSVENPAGAVTTTPKMNLVSACWIDNNSITGSQRAVEEPVVTVLTHPKLSLCTASFLVPSNFDNGPRSIDDPAPTVLASRKHINIASAFIVNPQYGNTGNSIDSPCPTVIASQHAYPLSLATAMEDVEPKWGYREGETEVMRELKDYMRENGIGDILMRMLFVMELKRIQGFPDNYILLGPKNKQKKHIGNSVETTVVSKWFEAIEKQARA